MENGWIKIHRKLMEWEWYGEPNMVTMWIHLLLSANHKPKQWHGKIIERGQLVTSLESLANSCGLSFQQTRTCLDRLVNGNQIIKESTNKYTLITICKYEDYQGIEELQQQTNNNPITNNQQTNNNPITTTEEVEDNNNINNNKNTSSDSHAHTREDFSVIEDPLTQAAQLVMMRMGWDENDYGNAVDEFRLICEADGKTHTNDADIVRHFRSWASSRYRNGEKPLSSRANVLCPTSSLDAVFAEFYRRSFGTDFIWQTSTSDDIRHIADNITAKISENGGTVDGSTLENSLGIFLQCVYRLGDEWINTHFNPSIINRQFNELYARIKNNATGKSAGKKAGNPTGVSIEYLERISRELTGEV